ncbi:MAG: 2-oxoacid:acceptor oxidoreductase subunit alpha [Candidatus Levybacteria bacterium]|nr:2-oxoacid:acceptor oxidoreductase subunit alpha [Candidatus Levybacteria bacterium]
MTDIQWLIGGEAGYGIMTIGVMMSKIFTRLGLSVFDYVEYPSLIRGGHNAYYVRGASEQIFSQKKSVDIIVALNRETIDKHKQELSDGAAIIYDDQLIKVDPAEFALGTVLIPVPFAGIIKQINVDRLMINTVAVGASLGLIHDDFNVLEKIMQDVFSKKGEEVVIENINAAKSGFEYVQKNSFGKFKRIIEKNILQTQKNILIGGGESVALGAIQSGVNFSAIYPMTPVNGVMMTLIAQSLKYGIVAKEPEDEIAGINMAIGASFAGARSMVATSGGGFSLMVESVGLAAQTETPLVIVEGMRPGPATGMPTWTGQGDLRFVLHAGQDDFPRVVIAPGDMLEAFNMSMNAFNIADICQLPVILVVDKYLMEGHATVPFDKISSLAKNFVIKRGKIISDEDVALSTDYKRYSLVDDGISPRSIPGQKGGIALSGSDEHDERGLYNEEAEVRIKMMNKRFKKLESLELGFSPVDSYGLADASLTIVGFGSTKMPTLEAMNWLAKENISVNFLKINCLAPFPVDAVISAIGKSGKTLIIEGNKTGQLEGLIREYTGLTMSHNFRKYDGRPFYPEEIIARIKEVL